MSPQIEEHRHHRWRRAPAVWGEPAPDYSAVNLGTPSTTFFLYALLFVDLKTSDHYRREHEVVKREVMRLANEANFYFIQINIRLLVVDILETFRADLSASLYSFEHFRNQRLAQLPFHDIAVLVTHRHAGGLAFIGGLCSGRNVMMVGFYPHNPEAMASIFFHEVAHLIGPFHFCLRTVKLLGNLVFGVPHRPVNETFAIPNCACPRSAHKATAEAHDTVRNAKSAASYGANVDARVTLTTASSDLNVTASTMTATSTSGCLKIPGFDHDCSLQWMVNLVQQHNRCLSQRLRSNLSTLALCGNGVAEGLEQCDCGPHRTCTEWNCEAHKCTLRWPTWTLHLALAFCASLVLFFLALGWRLCLRRNKKYGTPCKMNCLAILGTHRKKQLMWRDHFVLMMPKRHNNFTSGIRNSQIWPKFKWPIRKRRKAMYSSASASSSLTTTIDGAITTTIIPRGTNFKQRRHFLSGKRPISSIWGRVKVALGLGRNCEVIGTHMQQTRTTAGVGFCVVVVRRPIRPPPPPPIFRDKFPCAMNTAAFGGSRCPSLHRPKMAPPLAPPAKTAQKSLRPTAPPPEPPKQQKRTNDGEEEQQRDSSAAEEDEWDSD